MSSLRSDRETTKKNTCWRWHRMRGDDHPTVPCHSHLSIPNRPLTTWLSDRSVMAAAQDSVRIFRVIDAHSYWPLCMPWVPRLMTRHCTKETRRHRRTRFPPSCRQHRAAGRLLEMLPASPGRMFSAIRGPSPRSTVISPTMLSPVGIIRYGPRWGSIETLVVRGQVLCPCCIHRRPLKKQWATLSRTGLA